MQKEIQNEQARLAERARKEAAAKAKAKSKSAYVSNVGESGNVPTVSSGT